MGQNQKAVGMVAKWVYMRFVEGLFQEKPIWTTEEIYSRMLDKWPTGHLPTKNAMANILLRSYKNMNRGTNKDAEWIK